MKKILFILVVLTLVSCAPKQRTIVVLSTNDMHAAIQNFPQLATAVEACRDTATVILVDAGDRWTGNAFVDQAENRTPILDLMNKLGFDVATLGNHEFDEGHAVLGNMINYTDFPIVCANMISDTTAVPQTPPYAIIERDGLKIGFVGVVTNYERPQQPAGRSINFTNLTFPDPQQMAAQYGEIADKCDLLVLVSHMGTGHDRDFLAQNTAYDLVIGGHSHEIINEVVNGTLLTQTGKNLKNVGATVIRMTGKKIDSISFRLVPLAGYTPSVDYKQLVDTYYNNPELLKIIGEMATTANTVGLANLITAQMADEADTQVAMYHLGGIRVDSISQGAVNAATAFSLDPFGSFVLTVKMTPEQMRQMIISKFNDIHNTKEAHRIDLFATTPYTIITNAKFDAVDVKFPQLKEGVTYSVALPNYVVENYDFQYTEVAETDHLITDLLMDAFEDSPKITPDNTSKQVIK
ncbi:MAG: bifunctional UDP-sugar hydrolase/5'-nucleotidase [Alistipes sp.]